MNKSELRNLIAAPFTPMHGNGELNLGMIAPYATYLIEAGISGAFVCGTTGEGPSLTVKERKSVLEEWTRVANGDLKVICHIGGTCLEETMELASHAERSGAYATAAVSPYFFKPGSPQEMVDYFKPVASAASSIPFYYYNIPSFTGVNMPVSDVLASVGDQIPNFAGVKFTHYDLYDMQKCIAMGRFNVLHGFDETLLCGLSLGVKGAVGSTYNYLPGLYLGLWRAFEGGDMESARRMQQMSVDAVKVLNRYRGGVVAGKAIMKMIGIDCGPCRMPLKNLSEAELDAMRGELSAMDFFRLSALKAEAIL